MEVHEVETEIRALPQPVSIMAQREAVLPLILRFLIADTRQIARRRKYTSFQAAVIITKRDAIGAALAQRIADGEKRAASRKLGLLMLIDIHGLERDIARQTQARIGRALRQEDFLQFQARLVERGHVERQI